MSFNDDFRNFDDQIDKQIKRGTRFLVVWFAFCACLTVGGLAFVIWVVVMLLRHFGVV